MAVVFQDVLDLDLNGEFSGVQDEAITCIIDEEAVKFVGEIAGECQDKLISYMAAHILSRRLRSSSSPAGPVVGQSSGGLSRTYAGPSGVTIFELDLQSTTYGQSYLRLARTIPTTPMVAYA